MNQFYNFISVFYRQDIRPRKKTEITYLLKMIKSNLYNGYCKEFWVLLVKYISNIYTQEDQILEIFEYVKPKIKIQKWE